MGFAVYGGQWRTLQTSFDFLFPEFLITGEERPGFGYESWIVVEQGASNDNRLRPGETVTLAGFNSLTNSVDAQNALEYTYEGAVDLDGDGWLDSLMLSRFSSEMILSDLLPFVNFQPFLDEVVLNEVSWDVAALVPTPPPTPVETDLNFIDGTREDETLKGSRRDDFILGKGGDDRLIGRAGDDLLDGGRGRDRIEGGKGNDALWGGPGRDTLFGGSGDDSFWFDTRSSFDKIRDYEPGESLVVDRDGDYSGVKRRNVEIIEMKKSFGLYIDDDLAAKIYGATPSIVDIILL
jgi:Ca2+-binding RTX toxin-like protein